jgi:hypothetical protein
MSMGPPSQLQKALEESTQVDAEYDVHTKGDEGDEGEHD